MNRSVSQVTKVLRKKENTLNTAAIFHIKTHMFSYHEIAIDGLFHYSKLYDIFCLLKATVDLQLAPFLRKPTQQSPKHPFYFPDTGSGF